MLGQEELPGHLGSHARPIGSRHRSVRRKVSCGLDRRDTFGHLKTERAHVVVEDLERCTEPGDVMQVAFGKAWPFPLLLAQLGQRMQTAAEQRSHLLRSHRIAGA
jgi:hypothetical protein